MRIAVTGSSGFIGRPLQARLKARGHEVITVTRNIDSAASGARGGSDRLGWDPEAGHIDAAGFEELDAVIHLAGEPIAAKRWSEAQKQRIADSRSEGTTLLAATLAGLADPPGVLISGSAIGFYGSRADEILDENSSSGSDFLAEVCRNWEAAADPAREAGIRVVHPRTGVVLHRSGGALKPMMLPFRLGLGGRMGNGHQYMSWISLHDQVEALIWLLDADVHGPVNLVAPNPVTNREFVAALGKALRRPTLLPTPKPALWARLGRELAEALAFSSTRAVPSVLVDNGFEFTHPDLGSGLQAALAEI